MTNDTYEDRVRGLVRRVLASHLEEDPMTFEEFIEKEKSTHDRFWHHVLHTRFFKFDFAPCGCPLVSGEPEHTIHCPTLKTRPGGI